MRVAYHIGAHCTDEGQLLKSLQKNHEFLDDRSIFVPLNHKYRSAIRDVIVRLRGAPAGEDAQDLLLSEIMGDKEADRLILSFDHFLGGPARVLDEGMLYPTAAERSKWLTNLFPDDPCDLFFAIRDPASFLPAVYSKVSGEMSFADFLKGLDPRDLSWTDVILRIRDANPDCTLTVWCNEDTPLIWPTVLREVTDLDQLVQLDGEYDVIRSIMKPRGFKQMLQYLESRPPQSEIQRRRVMAAFLDKFADEGKLAEEFDLPGWTDALMDELSALYEEDAYEIERLAGVNMITT